MLLKLALLSSSLTATAAFVPSSARHTLHTASSALGATVEDSQVVRQAPDAGWVPEWEDRLGLPESEFLASDMTKPDLAGMWECPLTRWDSEGYVHCKPTCNTLDETC